MGDKERFDLTGWQLLLLVLLEFFTKRQWKPEDYQEPEPPEPPEPPAPELPEWVKGFGDLSRYISRYAKSSIKAFYQVEADKAPVFFPAKTYKTEDGHIKHIFEARTSDTCPKLLAIGHGAVVLCYKDKVPNSVKADAKEYADGKVYIEICDPAGGVIWPEHVELLGYMDEDGNYIDLNYPGL